MVRRSRIAPRAKLSRIVGAHVLIRVNPHAEALALLAKPARRITRRASVDVVVRPNPIPQRRHSLSHANMNGSLGLGNRAQMLQQFGLERLGQLDEVCFF